MPNPRLVTLAVLLAAAGVLVVIGAAHVSSALAWLAAGVLLAAWTIAVFGDRSRTS